ncbi:MAG: GNAT family N-acetyltransferase [Candidatus Aegiribacteria sp.]|nr:GNAT family N-acetyltransferase [Candidatus Aegiribacteria sp.]
MPDLLVPLYDLPGTPEPDGLWVGKPLSHQAPSVLSFIQDNFSSGWKAEAGVAFGSVPPTIIAAVDKASGRLAGFCCWDCTAKGFLGPIGVHDDFRGKGVGKAVVIAALHSMREAGYGYAVIGAAGPVKFFQSICDARIIESSTPGIYDNPLT